MSWVDIRRNISDEISILFVCLAEAALPEPLLDDKNPLPDPQPTLVSSDPNTPTH